MPLPSSSALPPPSPSPLSDSSCPWTKEADLSRNPRLTGLLVKTLRASFVIQEVFKSGSQKLNHPQTCTQNLAPFPSTSPSHPTSFPDANISLKASGHSSAPETFRAASGWKASSAALARQRRRQSVKPSRSYGVFLVKTSWGCSIWDGKRHVKHVSLSSNL